MCRSCERTQTEEAYSFLMSEVHNTGADKMFETPAKAEALALYDRLWRA